MPYGYLGTEPNQKVKNEGVVNVNDVARLQALGQWGGSLELIQKQAVSGTQTVDFNNIQPDKYDVFKCYIDVAMTSGYVHLRLYESGTLNTGTNYDTSGYYNRSSNVHGSSRGYSQTAMNLSSHQVNGRYGSEFSLYLAYNSSSYTFLDVHAHFQNNESFNYYGGGNLNSSSVVDGFRVYSTGSNMTGNIFLYGVKQISE